MKPLAISKFILGVLLMINLGGILEHKVYSSQFQTDPTQNPYLNQGDRCFQDGQYECAIQAFQNAIANDPSQKLVRLVLGMAYSKLGDQDKAIQEWERLIQEVAPDTDNAHVLADAYYNLGVAYYKKSETEKAIQALEEAITTNKLVLLPNKALFVDAYQTLADIYAEQSRWPESASVLEKAGTLDQSQVFDSLAYVMIRLQNWGKAEYAAKQSIALNPFGYKGHHLLGMAYCAQGKSDLAKQQSQRLSELGHDATKLQGAIQRFCNTN